MFLKRLPGALALRPTGKGAPSVSSLREGRRAVGGRGVAGSREGRDAPRPAAPAGVRRQFGRLGPSPALRAKHGKAELGSCLHASRGGSVEKRKTR